MDSLNRREMYLRLASEYQELNGHTIDCLTTAPSALEFSRLVRIGRPFLISPTKPDKNALLRAGEWSDTRLLEKLGSKEISIAVTPDGKADALASHTDGKTYFVEPLTERMTMEAFLRSLDSDEETEVRYLQSQNGNIWNASSSETELQALRSDVPLDVPWATQALNRSPDAVNLWIGDHRSATSLHSDPYENIYTVIRGVKVFTLLPPTEACFLRESLYPHATYTRQRGVLSLAPSDPGNHDPVPWSSFDVSNPPIGAMPITVEVNSGETLYLPAGWFHQVRQGGSGGRKGVCVAVNWWYDIEMQGMEWVWLSFLREGSCQTTKQDIRADDAP